AGPPAATTERGARGQVDLPGFDPRPAAVLCALFDDGGDAAVVLTRRSATLRSHTGEVSFPGGRLDPGETPLDAALREAEEEIGLDPGGVEIIGTLRPLSTSSSGSLITPFVGVLPGRPRLRPNAAEVARVFTVTLAELVAPGTYHEEIWEREGGAFGVHFFEVPGETVWGATARMLRDLLDRVLPAPR
ncbi:NUDIX domain-containing protein, partial [Acidimicrobiaceae bacterium USS-CC1]|nr:NUDIX domain-containing protein [Acidiferrimicrobium australe]